MTVLNSRWSVGSLILITVLFPFGLTAEAQQLKLPVVAFLAGGSRSGDFLLIRTFWQRMNELGYSEGRTLGPNTASLREPLNVCPTLQRNWCV